MSALPKDVDSLSTEKVARNTSGVQYLLDSGLKGDTQQLQQVVDDYGNDAFVLQCLSAYLNRWYAGRLNGLGSIPELSNTDYTHNVPTPLARVLAAFEKKLYGTSDLTLLYLLSLSDQHVPQYPMKLVFRSTLMERWLTRRDDYVRFLGPLGRLNEEHWHWVIENLRRLQLLEPPLDGRHDLLLTPELVRKYFQARLQQKSETVFKQAQSDMEKLFKETVVDMQKHQLAKKQPAVAQLQKIRAEQEQKRKQRLRNALWKSSELDKVQEQLSSLRQSLGSLGEHSHKLRDQVTQLSAEKPITPKNDTSRKDPDPALI